jgi:formiminotetrahydrofolate cyclodeaminase
VNEFEAWLEEMVANPLPGGVAAAAMGAAMGAALVAKVAAIGQSGPAIDAGRQRALQALFELAQSSRRELVQLAAADEVAYRRVLATQRLPADDEARRHAWQRATDVTLSVAETSRHLLAELPAVEEVGPSGVAVDLEIGQRLLEVGMEAGRLAAGENQRASAEDPHPSTGRRHVAALYGGT